MKKLAACILFFGSLAVCSTAALPQEIGYKIGPGDTLEISVWKDEVLSTQIIVPPDGMIAFPLIKDIDVTELTVPELREIVTKRLSEYVPGPTVTVMLIKTDSLMAYVIGKVNKPGQFPITMETNVMQILSLAGGLNPYASPNKIIILRQEGGKSIKIPFNYEQMEKGENIEQNIILRRGDIVVVP